MYSNFLGCRLMWEMKLLIQIFIFHLGFFQDLFINLHDINAWKLDLYYACCCGTNDLICQYNISWFRFWCWSRISEYLILVCRCWIVDTLWCLRFCTLKTIRCKRQNLNLVWYFQLTFFLSKKTQVQVICWW